jgi:hypothetical protein
MKPGNQGNQDSGWKHDHDLLDRKQQEFQN